MQLKQKRTIAQKAKAITRSIRKFGDPDGDRLPKLTALQQAAQAMGRKGGKSKSPAKVAASRENGKQHKAKACDGAIRMPCADDTTPEECAKCRENK